MSIIEATGLSKRYRRLASGRPRTIRSLAERTAVAEHWALRDVTFQVERGETLGVIGANGNGKSTLLRILAGITQRTSGAIATDGQVGAVLALGGGFHPMLSGKENALTGALLGGLSRREATERIPEIARFAELEEEMRQPLRMLSDGQRMRLAFSVAINIDPDILLLDEVLAVGDLRFQEKCFERLEMLQSNGVTIVVVSHDMAHIRMMTDRAMWLEDGRVREIGRSAEVTERYERNMLGDVSTTRLPGGGWRIGTHELEIVEVRVRDAQARETSRSATGDPITVEIDFTAKRTLPEVIFSVALHGRDDERTCLNVDTESDDASPGSVGTGTNTISLTIDRLDLAGGSYLVDVGAYSPGWEETYDYWWAAIPLEIRGQGEPGLISPPRTWDVR